MMRKAALLLAIISSAAAIAVAAPSEDQRIARLSYIEGHVSFQHPGEVDWSAATINMALQVADRLYTGETGRAEVQFDDGSVLRLAEQTDVEILAMREDLVQVRILLGLASLTARGSVPFEIDTPAAAFSTMEKGAYRFDVIEKGDSDAIVREGLLNAFNQKFSSRIEKGELLHVTPGEQGTNTLARYDQRDSWDEWTDRRDADLTAYQSRQYIPDYVYAGASDLDRYGYWVDVGTYGPAWVPYYVGASWSPYWDGRWVYRPFWGWTWVSYEPWGWLPYHYGSWYFAASIGWCWLPGPSFGFHFWSPGLVRFYHGPGWVSWCPLGPGDYYNANHYFYYGGYGYQLTNMRLLQHRGPDDLVNHDAPGAVRRMEINDFVNGGSAGGARLAQSDSGFFRNSRRSEGLVSGTLPVQPSARSFMPDPDRASARPGRESSMPTVVRNMPAAGAAAPGRFIRAGTTASPLRSMGSRSAAVTNRDASRTGEERTWTTPPAAARGDNPAVPVQPPTIPATGSQTRVWNRVTPAPENSERGLPGTRTSPVPSPRQPVSPARSIQNPNPPERPTVQPRAVEPVPRTNSRPPIQGRAVEPVNPRNRGGASPDTERRPPQSVSTWSRRAGSAESAPTDGLNPAAAPLYQEYRPRTQATAMPGRSYSPGPMTGGMEAARPATQYRTVETPSWRSYQSGMASTPSRMASPQIFRAPSMSSRPTGIPAATGAGPGTARGGPARIRR